MWLSIEVGCGVEVAWLSMTRSPPACGCRLPCVIPRVEQLHSAAEMTSSAAWRQRRIVRMEITLSLGNGGGEFK
jgi:hypothetical protein